MLFGIFKTFSGSKVQLVEFLYEIADTFPLYSIQLSGFDIVLKLAGRTSGENFSAEL